MSATNNLLRRIPASVKKIADTPKKPNKATNDKSQTKESHKGHLTKEKRNKTANAHCLPARPHEVPCVIHRIDKKNDGTDNLDDIAIAMLAPVIVAFGDAAHFGFLRFNAKLTGTLA
jgi:hypothetical protein